MQASMPKLPRHVNGVNLRSVLNQRSVFKASPIWLLLTVAYHSLPFDGDWHFETWDQCLATMSCLSRDVLEAFTVTCPCLTMNLKFQGELHVSL